MKPARLLLTLLAAALALPAAAAADPQYTTLLQSRTAGLDPFGPGVVNHSAATVSGISADGCRVAFTSHADGLLPAGQQNDRVQGVFVRDACTDQVFDVARTTSQSANDDSERPAISPNGRYVAFVSKASNLASPAPSLGVYVRDLTAGTTKLVSRRDGATGSAVGVWGYDPPAVSDTGAVAFLTAEPIASGDANGTADVYLRDGDTTTLISAGRTSSAMTPSISANGRRVAFQTSVAIDAEKDLNTGDDVYVRDLDAGTTTLVSRPTGAATEAGRGTDARVSGDGSAVVFVTTAALDAKDTNGTHDVYRREGDVTTLVSRKDGADTAAGNGQSTAPSVDATGDVVAFQSQAPDLGNEGNGYDADVFVRDLAANTTRMASRLGLGGAAADGESRLPSVSATHVAFETTSANLLAGDDDDFTRVVRRELATGTTELASRPAGSAPFSGGGVNEASLNRSGTGDGHVSADGRYVVFLSKSDALSPDDDDRVLNAFVRDNVTDTTTLVNRGDAEQVDHHGAVQASISDDGRRVAFTTVAKLDADDVDGVADVYVRDLVAGTTYLASRADGASAKTAGGNADEPMISGDGARVAFTVAGSLDAADANGKRDVYVRDIAAHETFLASPAAGEPATGPSIDLDGSHVAFETLAALDAADANAKLDVYRREVASDEIVLVSRAGGAQGAVGDGLSRHPSISADGSRIAFATEATNLSAGDATARRAVHLRDVAAGTTILVSRGSGGGAESDQPSDRPSISGDGRTVAFESDATNLGVSNPAGTLSYIRITNANSTRLASRATGGANGPANAASVRPSISANGACVAFTTRAWNLNPPYAQSDYAQVYMHAVTDHCPDEDPPETTITGGPEGTTGEATPLFAFAADEAGRFECAVDGGEWAPCASPQRLPEQADGPHTFAVRAIDATGNADPTPAQAQFSVDTDPPETTVASGPSGRIAASDATFGFEADEDGVRFTCELDGEGMEDCDPPSRTFESLADGTHTFSVVAIDAAGNADPTPATRTFEVDLTGPAVTIGAITAADDGSARVAFTTDGTARCAIDGGELQACTSPFAASGLAAGEHTVRVQATDDLGNAGAVATKAFVVPAKQAPPQGGGQGGQPQQQEQQGQQGEQPNGEQPAPPSGPSPVAPAGGRAPRLGGTSLKVDRKGRVTLRLTCEAACTGTATLTAKIGKRTMRLARGTYSIGAGRTATLRLRLAAAGRRELKAKRRLAAKVALTGAAAPVAVRLRG